MAEPVLTYWGSYYLGLWALSLPMCIGISSFINSFKGEVWKAPEIEYLKAITEIVCLSNVPFV